VNDYSRTPPIPEPIGQPHAVAVVSQNLEWKDAPPIVKGWAYPLTWLSIIIMPLLILMSIIGVEPDEGVIEKIVTAGFLSLMWGIAIWHNRALKKGLSYAWGTQIVLSVLGLFGFPLGTLINIYILSQWGKPETKRWFGKV